LLHDIGWLEGRKRHHKTALRLIMEAKSLPLSKRERRLVGAIARYHRKALPDEGHEEFAALDAADRRRLCLLAGILRVADGLDRSHLSLIRDLHCDVDGRCVRLRCRAAGDAEPERWAAAKKADLFQTAFERSLILDIMVDP
jgi:exopolyphosphatase/guanosine-5'-triphosphate,3'-diphosphate pyrophosphatase